MPIYLPAMKYTILPQNLTPNPFPCVFHTRYQPQISPQAKDFIRKMLIKNPNQRATIPQVSELGAYVM